MKDLETAIQEITLRIGQIGAQRIIEEWPFAEQPEVRSRYLIESARWLLAGMVRYAEQPCEPVKYPADWWQAVKERFAPAWALKRWPVVYTIWEPSVIYPDIKLPDRAHYVKIRKLDFLPDWPLS